MKGNEKKGSKRNDKCLQLFAIFFDILLNETKRNVTKGKEWQAKISIQYFLLYKRGIDILYLI